MVVFYNMNSNMNTSKSVFIQILSKYLNIFITKYLKYLLEKKNKNIGSMKLLKLLEIFFRVVVDDWA